MTLASGPRISHFAWSSRWGLYRKKITLLYSLQSKEAEIPVTFPRDLWTPQQVDKSRWYLMPEAGEVEQGEEPGGVVSTKDQANVENVS